MTNIRSTSTSRVQDRRGQGGGSSGGLGTGLGTQLGGGGSIPGGLGGLSSMLKGGGSITGLLLVAAVFFLPKLLGGASTLAPTSSASSPANVDSGSLTANAPSAGGDTACTSEIEQIVCGAVDNVSDYWVQQTPISFQGQRYVEAPTVFFSGNTDTGCGYATSATGPFYCPADSTIYIDLDFLQQLQTQFSATGDLASQYIVAHEYGHHIQNLIGINEQVRQAQQQNPSKANQYSIALELQADCFGGAWAKHADQAGLLEQGEVSEAINAAGAVGDDRIQQQVSGRVDPDSWTHGSGAQREQWFKRGFTTGDPNQCTTFSEVL